MIKMVSVIRGLKWGHLRLFQRVFEHQAEKPAVVKMMLFSSKTVKRPELVIPTYTRTENEYKVGRKYTVQTLETLFGISTFNAFDIAMNNKNLCKVSSLLIKSNHSKYLENGVTAPTLLKYPQLLAEMGVESRIKEVKKLPQDINTVAALMLMPLKQLEKFVRTEIALGDVKNRVTMLSGILQKTEQETCELLCKRAFLRSMSVERVESTIKLLTDFGITTAEICNDLWVLRYSHEQISNRLNDARNHKIETLKTWMVRAQPEIFETYIRRRSDNKLILGNSSLAEYLSERLDCNVETANYLIHKQPVLRNKSLKKLKELIDFLFSEGFKPNHIVRVPKILVHSVKTTKKRLKQLEDKGFQIDSLHMLTKSQKQFNQYYEALVKSKLKNKT